MEHSVSAEGSTSRRPLPVPASRPTVTANNLDEDAASRRNPSSGTKKRRLRHHTANNSNRQKNNAWPRNNITLEGLLLSFATPLALCILIFSVKNALLDTETPSQKMRASKSTFLDENTPKRMAMKSYLEEQKTMQSPLESRRERFNMIVEPKRVNNKHTQQQQQQQQPINNAQAESMATYKSDPNRKVVTTFLEPPTSLQEDTKPLPRRNTKASQLQIQEFPEVQYCSTFLRDFGRSAVDHFPTQDPYLPWLHDFFPTHDGTTIKFIGQNRRNCQTGVGMEERMQFWAPQIALFQPVPVVVAMAENTGDNNTEPVFRLADDFEHATARETRFICRFHNSNSSKHAAAFTLSEFPFNYEFVSWRKHHSMLEEESSKGSLNQSPFWVSQLLFACPVPEQFQPLVQQHRHVVNDQAQLWVDVIPIRTPPRFGGNALLTNDQIGHDLLQEHASSLFDLAAEYGSNHSLPLSSDSGRWANLPICHSPSLPVPNNNAVHETLHVPSNQADYSKVSLTMHDEAASPGKKKPHRLVACTWTSASYQRRGNAVTVRDSHARLREWILFHKMVGFDHVYIYDNSPMNNNGSKDSLSLEDVAREFTPDTVTYVSWPCTVCSNNRPMHKNPGDRSSQYAAEASCRERFGPSTEWMSFIDTDEYLVPMTTGTWKNVLDDMDRKNVQVLKMRSSRGLPRHDLMESLENQESCEIPTTRSTALRKLYMEPCQEPKRNETFLKVYNCDFIKPPRPGRFARAMKQMYRPQYVLSHYVHYSTVTQDIARYHKEQTNNTLPNDSSLVDWKEAGSDKEVFLDELEQGTLIHARSVLPHETVYRSDMCRSSSKHKCPLGYMCPNSTEWIDDKVQRGLSQNPFVDELGNYCNCWVNDHIENVIVPRLEQEVRQHRLTVLQSKSR